MICAIYIYILRICDGGRVIVAKFLAWRIATKFCYSSLIGFLVLKYLFLFFLFLYFFIFFLIYYYHCCHCYYIIERIAEQCDCIIFYLVFQNYLFPACLYYIKQHYLSKLLIGYIVAKFGSICNVCFYRL